MMANLPVHVERLSVAVGSAAAARRALAVTLNFDACTGASCSAATWPNWNQRSRC